MTDPVPSLLRKDPFRLLFPIGYACLILGLGIGVQGLPWRGLHAGFYHALLLEAGFLAAFAYGILLSETPRLTKRAPPGTASLAVLAVCMVLMAASALAGAALPAYGFHLLASASALRILWPYARGNAGHPGPALAALAPALTIPFSLAGILGEAGLLPEVVGRVSLLAASQAAYLLFCAACARWSGEANRPGSIRARRAWTLGAALVLFASILAEVAAVFSSRPDYLLGIAYLIRILWAGWFLVPSREIRPLLAGSPGFQRGFLAGFGLVLAGTVAAAWKPVHGADWIHFTFLPGFAWTAIVLATALITRDPRSPGRAQGAWLAGLAGLPLAAAFALRVTAGYSASPWPWLSAAALLALAPLTAWGLILIDGKGRKP